MRSYTILLFLITRLAQDCYALILTCYVRMQCSYFCLLCSGENLRLVLCQVVDCLPTIASYITKPFMIFLRSFLYIMLALCLVISETYYAGIIGQGLFWTMPAIIQLHNLPSFKLPLYNTCFVVIRTTALFPGVA